MFSTRKELIALSNSSAIITIHKPIKAAAKKAAQQTRVLVIQKAAANFGSLIDERVGR